MKYNKLLSFGYDRTGKRIRKWFHADTLAELNAKIEAYKDELKKVSNPSEVTFAAYSEKWLEVYKANRSKQTIDMYKNALKKCGTLDPYKLKKVTKSMCQAVINESWEHPSTASKTALTLKQVFKSAMADGIIATNPADALTLPKKPNSRFYLLTKEDLEKIRRADLSPMDRLYTTVLQVFGLRPAEALALQPSDFDFENGILHISKSLELSNDNRSRIKPTKTGAVRDIPIPEQLIAPLKAQIQGIYSFYIFTKGDGSLHTKSSYRKLSARLLKAFDVPKMTLYSFRHRRATDLYYLTQTAESGVTAKYASSILGHSELVFLSTYSHVDEQMESKNIYKNFDLSAIPNL